MADKKYGSTPDRLGRLATFYQREAQKCARAKAHFGAVVMQTSALEAALQSICAIYIKDVKTTSVYQKKKFRSVRNKVLELRLDQLIRIADELQWFPSRRIMWAGKRTNLAGFAHEVRKVRNLVHPGLWARERSNVTKFTKATYDAVYEVCDVANSWLIHRIEQGLLKAMAREENKKRGSS